MDIKDSYLHGTVGVVKSISVSADKLKYKLADIAGTVKEVTLPVATTSANGLMSSGDKTKLDNLSTTLGNYVTLNTDQEITGTKTFTKQLKFTVEDGTAPFTVTSNNKVTNLNADLLDGLHHTDFVRNYGIVGANYSKGCWLGYTYPNEEHGAPVAGGVISAGASSGMQIVGHHGGSYLYYRGINGSNFTEWKQVAFTDSNITGNAATATHASTADKLKTKRKLWGLDFDGTADVSGSLTGVTSINAVSNLHLEIKTPSGSNKYIYLRYNSSLASSVLLTGTYFGPSSDSSGKLSLGTSADKWDHVYAKTFIGNLDGSYINKLTGYTKATTIAALAATDTLNTALGKLEFKTDFIYNDLFGTDNDDVINKWHEIVDFIDSVKEGTDITDEFVTRKTNLTITGLKTFNKDVIIYGGNYGVRLLGSGEYGYLQLGLWAGDGTKIHKGQITGIYNETLTSLNIKSKATTATGTFTATKFITSGGTSSLFVKGDGSLDSNTYLTTTGANNNFVKYVKTTMAEINKTTYNPFIFNVERETLISGYGQYWYLLNFGSYSGGGYRTQLAMPYYQGIKDTDLFIRSASEDSWRSWRRVLHEGNYTSYVNSTNFPGLAGVRSVTINSNYLRVNTNGTNTDLTIPYASVSDLANSLSYNKLPSCETNASNTVWCKFARLTFNTSTWQSSTGYFFFGGLEGGDHIGILYYLFRSASTATTLGNGNLHWVIKCNSIMSVIAEKVSDNVYDLYINNYSTYKSPVVYHMSPTMSRFSWNIGSWTTTKPTAAYTASDAGRVNYANSAESATTATTATKLGTSTIGSADRPIYLNAGTPIKTTYRMASTNVTASAAVSVDTTVTGIWYVNGTSGIYNLSDGAAITNAYSSAWASQIYLDYRTGLIALRGKKDGTWQAWRKVLDDSNYNDTLDKSYVKYVVTTKAVVLNTNNNPFVFNVEGESLVSAYKSYWYGINFGPHTQGGNYCAQIAIPYLSDLTDTDLFIRSAKSTTWRSWRRVLHDNNYTSYTVKKDGTGATGTWGISITGNAGSASTSAKLSSTTVISAKAFSLSNASWADTGYTFANLTTGTYAVQVTSGTNLVASGIMSVYKNLSDTSGDEIPLHVYGTAGWRPYLRTYNNKLLISSNDTSSTKRTVTIKIALIL